MVTSQPIDVAFSFDTTGSMYPCLREVRRHMTNTITGLFKNISNIRVAIIAHGDYCDKDNPYTIRFLDFSKDVHEICHFIDETKHTHGGDTPECYELVLNTARKHLSWNKNAIKVLTVIGDALPHGPSYPENTRHLDWMDEAKKCAENSIKIYAVHAMPGIRTSSRPFYETIAKVTDGLYLTLDQFSEINYLIEGICYKQDGPEKLSEFVERIKPKATRNLQRVISTLSGKTWDESEFDRKFTKAGLIPVPSGRFQVFSVLDKIPIKKFVIDQGINFKIGRGFYELTKSEDVQQYKEIILQNRNSGDFFSGAETRELLGLRPQIEGSRGSGTTERLKPIYLNQYRVFIQSTSVNRALMPGTGFLYEVPDWESDDKSIDIDDSKPSVTDKIKMDIKSSVATFKKNIKTEVFECIDVVKDALKKSPSESGTFIKIEIPESGHYKITITKDGKTQDIDPNEIITNLVNIIFKI